MRQKKLMAVAIAIVMAITALIPTLAFAREKPRPNNNRRPAMTQMQKKIHQNSVAKNNRRTERRNRPYADYHHYKSHFYGGYYYGPYYLSNYFGGPAAYRWSYLRHELELEDLASIALDAAYASYMSRQNQKVVVLPSSTQTVTTSQPNVVIVHSESW